jgi:ABC-2 type transport system permease protein
MEPESPHSLTQVRSGLGRHLRSVGRFWSTSLATEFEYQFNLLVELLAVLATMAGSLFTLSLFYGHGQRLGGWSWDGALVVLGLHSLFEGFSSTLLRPNLGNLVKQVQNGGLDFVLLKPIDSQVWLSVRTISPWGLPEMGLGLVLALVGVVRSGVQPTPQVLAFALTLLLSGAMILYSLWFLLAATSIWFVKIWNATEVLRSLLAAGRYPVTAYPPLLRLLFSTLLPVAFLTTVPAEALLGLAGPRSLLLSGALAVVSLVASRLLWQQALRHYTSASS